MRKLILLILFSPFVFSQSKIISLEEKIYAATEIFVANPNVSSLKKLEREEQNFKPKSKVEILAFIILKCNKAYFQRQFGLTQEAIKNYETAWLLYQKNKPDPFGKRFDIIEFCLKPLGNLYAVIGDYDSAENTIKQYFYIANAQNNSGQKYAAILNLSNVFQNTGRLNESIDLLEKTINTEKLSPQQKGNLWGNLGNNYLLSSKGFGDKKSCFEKAENAFTTSVSLLKNDPSQAETLSNAYRGLSLLKLEENDINLAVSNFEKAQAIFLKIPNLEPRKLALFYYEQAVILFKQGSLNGANQGISYVFKTLIPNYASGKTVLPNKNSLYAETALLDALDLQAEIYLAQNQPKKALETYQLSFHIEDLFQSLLVYENSKIITQLRIRKRTEKCLDIYYLLYQKEKKDTYLESAFVLQEQSKSSVLKDAVSNKKNRSSEEKLILEQLQNWNNTILREQQKGYSADISKINEAIKKQNELMLLLKSKASKKTINSQVALNLKSLYLKLEKDGAVMQEYFFGENKIYSFYIEKNKIRWKKIDWNALAKAQLTGFIDLFTDSEKISANVSNYTLLGNQVCNLLQLPKKAAQKKLIIIRDGILNFLPFETLISKKSTTTNFAKMHYLLNDFTVGYNNSATFYLNSIPFQHQKERILGVFPIFENSNLELTFSKKELEYLKKHFDGTYLDGDKATFTNFKNKAFDFSILHLSTHASSGDIVDPASIKFYDQEILYSELYNLNINADLVVLSACETGLGKLYKAEGAMSVSRGFQMAGAQNLLFSLWKVNDFTTSVLMKNFYRNVGKGNSYFESVRKAKLDFLKDSSIPNAKKSPYYWGAFVYYGTLESKSSPTNYWIWASIIGGIIGLYLFRKNAQKRLKTS